MADVKVTITLKDDVNLEYLESIIGELPAYLDKYLWARLLQDAKDIAEEAKLYAPVKTGYMASQIFATVDWKGIGIQCEVNYAGFQEYGTKYIVGKHFICMAMFNNYKKLRKTVVDVINEYFKTVEA